MGGDGVMGLAKLLGLAHHGDGGMGFGRWGATPPSIIKEIKLSPMGTPLSAVHEPFTKGFLNDPFRIFSRNP